MSFTWPIALLLLLTVPLVLGVYFLAMRRRRRQAVTYSSLALLRTALPRRSRWRRHLPVALLLASLGLLALASARPQITSNVPIGRTSIILALDESRSMCSTDVQPNRLSVAQKAARDFVASQPKGTRMGLVVFSGFAELAVPPDDRPQGPGDRHQQPRHQQRHGDRRRHAEGARRHRRGQPAGPAGGQRRLERGSRPPGRRRGPRPQRRSPARTAMCPMSSCC